MTTTSRTPTNAIAITPRFPSLRWPTRRVQLLELLVGFLPVKRSRAKAAATAWAARDNTGLVGDERADVGGLGPHHSSVPFG